MNEKIEKQTTNKKQTNNDKITSPVSYPNYRSKKENISIPSDSNAELSRNWIEINKL